MAKHTPGQWRVKHSESKQAFNVIGTVLGGKYKIARFPYIVHNFPGYEGVNEREKDEAEANARLSAAATDMLEALEMIVEQFNDPSVLNVTPIAYFKGFNKAEEAIKKARP